MPGDDPTARIIGEFGIGKNKSNFHRQERKVPDLNRFSVVGCSLGNPGSDILNVVDVEGSSERHP